MKILDWYSYDEKVEEFPFTEYISIYSKSLTNKECESMITFEHVEDIISYDEYIIAETKIINFFIEIYKKKPIIYSNRKINNEITFYNYMKVVSDGCREYDVDFVILLDEDKIAFYIDYDLYVIINYYENKPDWMDSMVKKHGLFILKRND